jgi:hypothetical protein
MKKLFYFASSIIVLGSCNSNSIQEQIDLKKKKYSELTDKTAALLDRAMYVEQLKSDRQQFVIRLDGVGADHNSQTYIDAVEDVNKLSLKSDSLDAVLAEIKIQSDKLAKEMDSLSSLQ